MSQEVETSEKPWYSLNRRQLLQRIGVAGAGTAGLSGGAAAAPGNGQGENEEDQEDDSKGKDNDKGKGDCTKRRIFPALLTGNPGSDGPAIDTGVTYEAEPSFHNPGDTDERRLLDGDNEGGNWRDVVGFNASRSPVDVTFDFQDAYLFDKIKVKSAKGQNKLPDSVILWVSEDGSQWEKIDELTWQQQGWATWDTDNEVTARYLRLEVKQTDGQTVLNEVEAYGWGADEPGPDESMPMKRVDDGDLAIVDDGEPAASIIVDPDLRPETLQHLWSFKKYIHDMTGAWLPIRSNDCEWRGTQLLVGPGAQLPSTNVAQGLEDPAGISINVDGRHVGIVGGRTVPRDPGGRQHRRPEKPRA